MDVLPLIVQPDPDEPGCALVLVDGAVNGRACRFVLDTGAARSQFVDDGSVPGLAPHSTGTSTGALGTGTAHLATVDEVRLGSLHASGLDVWLVPDVHGAGGRHLLSMDFMIRACWRFSFSSNQLRVEPSPAPQATLPLDLAPSGHGFVAATWRSAAGERIEAGALWDTGASISVVDEGFFEGHRELFSAPGSSVGFDSTGARSVVRTYTVAGPEVGGRSFAAHRVAVVDLASANAGLARRMDVVLGYPLLSQADWIFDYPARRWAVIG